MSSHPPVVPTEVDSQQRTLEQRRAASAWANVEDVHTHGTSYEKEYGQLARSAPADIQTNGLGQTLAFWRAKANRVAIADVLDAESARRRAAATGHHKRVIASHQRRPVGL